MKTTAARAAIFAIIGLAAVVIGLVWMAQGLGWLHWPPQSFMLDQRPWAARGAGLALIGLIVGWRAFRRYQKIRR